MATDAPALPRIDDALNAFVRAAEQAFGASLQAVVLYGSAAEGRLRPTSDVNVLVVLHRFERAAADALRDALRQGHAAIRLRAMLVLHTEVDAATNMFPGKFSQIIQHHRMLHGTDPFAGVLLEPRAILRCTQQELFDQQLRLRGLYVEQRQPEERLTLTVAQSAGPPRACAATLMTLEGTSPANPKEALQSLAARLDPECGPLLGWISEARETTSLPEGAAPAALFGLSRLAGQLYRHAEQLAARL